MEVAETTRGERTVYHGARTRHNFTDTGYILPGTFFAQRQVMAEHFGSFIYEVVLKPHLKLFNASCSDQVAGLLKDVGCLYVKEYQQDRDERQLVAYAGVVTTTPDTWEVIETNENVLNWLLDSGYDGVKLKEKGEHTLLLFDPAHSLESHRLIHTIYE